jgi:hypothetical protein
MPQAAVETPDKPGVLEGARMMPEQKFIYWDKAKPEDFINVKVLDWIEGVGDITTESEREFIMRFGIMLRSRSHTPAPTDDIDLEALGNEDVDPKVFAAWGDACEKGAQDQFLREHDAAIARTATLACRESVFNNVIYNRCPFNGDCAQCFLCDNAGGCIIPPPRQEAQQ